MIKEVCVERTVTAWERKNLLEQITVFVDANLEKKITLKMIANRVSVSVSTVTQLFLKNSDTTFHAFLTSRRMERAVVMILRGEPLESVGKKLGNQDHSTFYRAFRNTFGLSPREYRKRNLGSN